MSGTKKSFSEHRTFKLIGSGFAKTNISTIQIVPPPPELYFVSMQIVRYAKMQKTRVSDNELGLYMKIWVNS
jgi:hypothetical protein